ncbi:competence type IV pilus minor pilin ComGF [Halobacillus litoralis]|uniref:competence type IV pilus minor pilin ComGF n=1 Tax=Halobacillus litoralis TaxID=45668 RepID=UPI001CFED938|nr:competence type IV pilus minor pilin ComGF [Halobacillus litoralis]WLR46280.1 competence type IV pilus minor pilin ComGF [Halobacillus litoralis]
MRKGNRSSEKAFTLAEVLISLMVTMILLTISVPLFSLLKGFDYYSELSIDQLGAVIQWEINQCRSYNVSDHSISLIDKQNRHIVMEHYGKIFRRTVDGSGHETLIQNVDTISFEHESPSIRMEVKIHDQTYTRKVHLP